MAEIRDYIRVNSIEEAFDQLHRSSPARIIAGGTDLLLQFQDDPVNSISLVDISDIEDLKGVQFTEEGYSIGAATKLADIVQSDLHIEGLDILIQGAGSIGSPQVRNLATIGGNICNASPSADTAGPLLTLEASAEITSPRSQRTVPLNEFFIGPRETVLEPDEILTAILVPKPPDNAVGTYIKLSTRKAMDLAIVGISVLFSENNGHMDVRIALGAVAPTPIRSKEAEEFLSQVSNLNNDKLQEAARLTTNAISPISDLRGSANYREEMVKRLTFHALKKVSANFG